MDYLPNTDVDRKSMLSAIGISGTEALFADIPEKARIKHAVVLPPAVSEPELLNEMRELSEKNSSPRRAVSFLGGGAYDHFIPSVVKHLASRSEFYTAYTPYQPELSQGMLQAIYEYQSMLCALTGMEVANASMYDGATACTEAASLSVRHTKRKKIAVALSLSPNYRRVLRTYSRSCGWEMAEIAFDGSGTIDIGAAEKLLGEDVACLIVPQPNFFGCVEDITRLSDLAHKAGALLSVSVDPISLGLLATPGSLGADIVTGEGLSLGCSPSFGGPGLGLFAVKKELMRHIPGRVVGQTTDEKGRRGFVLTLQAREQHIRREKAASNICSNEALNALQAAIYLSYMGKRGLRAAAGLCLQKAAYAKEKISSVPGYSIHFSAPSFKEFVIKCKKNAQHVLDALLPFNIFGGIALGGLYPGMEALLLVSCTELTTKENIDLLADKLRSA